MSKVLYSYLLQKHHLPIPGLGSIQLERLPAQTDFVNKQLLPPSFHFRFDKHFDAPDKDFFAFLAAQNNIADFEAIRWYNEWAYNLRNQIRNHKPITIDGLGILTMDLSGDIRFKPIDTIATFFHPAPAVRVSKSSIQHVIVRRGDSEVLANPLVIDQAPIFEVPEFEEQSQESIDQVTEETPTLDDQYFDGPVVEDKWRRNAIVILIVCILLLIIHSSKFDFKSLPSGSLQHIELSH